MPATPPGVRNASQQTRPLPQPPLCVSCIPRGLRGLPAALNNRDKRGSLPIVEEQAKPKVSPFRVTLRRFLRARITAGLIFVLPLWIAFLLVKFVFEVMRDTSLWVVESYLQSVWGERFLETWGVTAPDLAERGLEILPANVQWGISIFSVLLTILFLYLVGLFTANIIGKRLVKGVELLVNRLPLVKTVYKASKQILEAFTGDGGRDFQRVALIPYPSMEVRSIGFITALTKDDRTGEELCTCFLATTPNPTTGYVFVLRRSDVIELDWSMEDAISVIMSGGALVPNTLPFVCGLPDAAPLAGISPKNLEVKPSEAPKDRSD